MTFHSARPVYLLLTLVVVLLASCAQPFDFDFEDSAAEEDSGPETGPADGPVPIAVASDSFTLAWNPAEGDIEAYEVYVRNHGTQEWSFLAEVESTDTPSFTVDSAALSYGSYDFAVRSRLASGETSEYHTSLDSTADPGTGWWVDWSAG